MSIGKGTLMITTLGSLLTLLQTTGLTGTMSQVLKVQENRLAHVFL
jgi:hypothetical protein